MSRFPQRWRTQRNAIRNANCKTSWIIKILNAHCAFGFYPVACLSECLWTPLSAGCTVCTWPAAGLCQWVWKQNTPLCLEIALSSDFWKPTSVPVKRAFAAPRPSLVEISWSLDKPRCEQRLDLTASHFFGLAYVQFRISDQARGPAEFKHIIKRRKRN